MIGFAMIIYGNTGYEQPSYAINNYCLLRLMIDEKYQGQGYGSKAVKKIIEFIKTFPAGEAEYCWLSYKQDNTTAQKLYERFGYKETGEVINGENIALLKLSTTY